jgi:hypothetical protein
METLNEVKPKIGMSVSMGIGSDVYHQIIVKMERNNKTIYTMPARVILGGVALEDWNELPESIKAKRAADALELAIESRKKMFPTMRDGWAFDDATHCYTFRKNGRYAERSTDYCWLVLNDQYEYRDPSF